MQINRKVGNKKIIIGAVIALVLLGVSAGVFFFIQSNNRQDGVRRDANGVSLERSEDELAESEKIQKDPDNSKQSTNSDTPIAPATSPDTDLLAANVILTNTGTDNGKADASGFVSNIVEDGGSCIFTFSKDGQVITKPSSTSTNPTSTTCRTVSFDEKELSPGDWTVSLEYNSPRAAGKSNTMVLTIR